LQFKAFVAHPKISATQASYYFGHFSLTQASSAITAMRRRAKMIVFIDNII
jgi:hypothetical protein